MEGECWSSDIAPSNVNGGTVSDVIPPDVVGGLIVDEGARAGMVNGAGSAGVTVGVCAREGREGSGVDVTPEDGLEVTGGSMGVVLEVWAHFWQRSSSGAREQAYEILGLLVE